MKRNEEREFGERQTDKQISSSDEDVKVKIKADGKRWF